MNNILFGILISIGLGCLLFTFGVVFIVAAKMLWAIKKIDEKS